MGKYRWIKQGAEVRLSIALPVGDGSGEDFISTDVPGVVQSVGLRVATVRFDAGKEPDELNIQNIPYNALRPAL